MIEAIDSQPNFFTTLAELQSPLFEKSADGIKGSAALGKTKGSDLYAPEEHTPQATPEETKLYTETRKFLTDSIKFKGDVRGTELLKQLQEAESLKEGKPVQLKQQKEATERVSHHPVWKKFDSGLKKLSRLFTDRTVTVSVATVSAGIMTGVNAVVLAAMTRLSAAQAAGGSPPAASPSAQLPVNSTKVSRLAHAGYLANALTLVVSLPTLIFGISDLVSKLKQAVKTGKSLHEASGQYKWVQEQLITVKSGRFPDSLDEVRHRLTELGHPVEGIKGDAGDLKALEKALIGAEHTLSEGIGEAKRGGIGLSVGLGLGVASFTMTTVKSINAILGIAWIALAKGAGMLTATCQNISAVTSVLGPLGACLGLGLGGIGLLGTGTAAVKTQMEISAHRKEILGINARLDRAGNLSPVEKQVLVMEQTRLKNTIVRLAEKRRNVLLNFASTLALTVAGAAGLMLALGVVSGPGAILLSAVSVLLMGISAGISIAAYVLKKRGARALVDKTVQYPPDVYKEVVAQIAGDEEYINKLSPDELVKFIPGGAKLKGEERAKAIAQFISNPETYLSTYFQSLETAQAS